MWWKNISHKIHANFLNGLDLAKPAYGKLINFSIIW